MYSLIFTVHSKDFTGHVIEACPTLSQIALIDVLLTFILSIKEFGQITSLNLPHYLADHISCMIDHNAPLFNMSCTLCHMSTL